jgi:UDP-N-acetylglucosamine--N-acetylmuramyl-(pentapeptide) pyrophosphoryl-undecaprenol N-acetylglucosamine transferase
MKNEVRIIISGGGTGGHIFPAIAIANAIRKKVPEANILFVGALGRMEMEKVPAAGYPIKGLSISGFQRRLTWKNLSFPFKVMAALRKAKAICKEFNPQVVVGVGGYASGPLVKAATRLGIPAVLQEQNSYPGITNKILAPKAKLICVAYEGMDKYFPKNKILFTGNPVRQDMINLTGKRERAAEEFGLDPARPVALIVGGSLGARSINESIHAALQKFSDTGIQLIWQTGKAYESLANDAVAAYTGKGIVTRAFISRMDLAYSLADVVISRAGAISISELCVVAKPLILVPSPNVAEDHQTRNAMALVNRQAALLVKDAEARELLADTAIRLIGDEAACGKLISNISGMGVPDADEKIAGVVLSLMNQ